MRLNKFSIGQNESKSSGIKEGVFKMNSNSIAIIGKNGSGKTRLLNLIKSTVQSNFQNYSKSGDLSNIPKGVQNQLKSGKGAQLIGNLITLIKPDDLKNIKPKQQNPKIPAFEQVLELQRENYETNDYSVINQSSLSYFEKLSTRIIIEQINYSKKPTSNFKKTKLYQNFKSLADKFSALIEKELDFEIDNSNIRIGQDGSATGLRGNWLLNGRKLNYNELSDGERTLLSYILILFFQENYHYSKTKNSIILIDEPELHLHPEAQIKLIKGLQELVKDDGQLIVATHSLPVMSLFNYDQIYLMKDNELLSPNSSRPAQALEELIGLENQVKYLSNLFDNISSWAMSHFMFNNFEDPEVIESSMSTDPQFLQFKKLLISGDKKFLDFGCGLGRLIKLIKENNLKSKFTLIDAFEPNEEFNSELESIGIIDNVYNELSSLGKEYDLILLSNVLHEIPPNKIIESISIIKSSLSKTGVLVVIEDLVLRKGEKPNDSGAGYLVFNQDELKVMFNMSKDPIPIENDNPKYKDRLMCSVIPAEYMGNISDLKFEQALNKLKDRAYKNTLELRNKNDYDSGRSYGFYVQQYVNAEITLKEKLYKG